MKWEENENTCCAVEDCRNKGEDHFCPYDGARHHHGRIHYDCGHPKHSLKWRRTDTWFLICDEHYQVCKKEREEFEKSNKTVSQTENDIPEHVANA